MHGSIGVVEARRTIRASALSHVRVRLGGWVGRWVCVECEAA